MDDIAQVTADELDAFGYDSNGSGRYSLTIRSMYDFIDTLRWLALCLRKFMDSIHVSGALSSWYLISNLSAIFLTFFSRRSRATGVGSL